METTDSLQPTRQVGSDAGLDMSQPLSAERSELVQQNTTKHNETQSPSLNPTLQPKTPMASQSIASKNPASQGNSGSEAPPASEPDEASEPTETSRLDGLAHQQLTETLGELPENALHSKSISTVLSCLKSTIGQLSQSASKTSVVSREKACTQAEALLSRVHQLLKESQVSTVESIEQLKRMDRLELTLRLIRIAFASSSQEKLGALIDTAMELQKSLDHSPRIQKDTLYQRIRSMTLGYRSCYLWAKNHDSVAFSLFRKATSAVLADALMRADVEELAHMASLQSQAAEDWEDRVRWLKMVFDFLAEQKSRFSRDDQRDETLAAAEGVLRRALERTPKDLALYSLQCRYIAKLKATGEGGDAFISAVVLDAVRSCPLDVDDDKQIALYMGMIHMVSEHEGTMVALQVASAVAREINSRVSTAEPSHDEHRQNEDQQKQLIGRLLMTQLYLLTTFTQPGESLFSEVEDTIRNQLRDIPDDLGHAAQAILWQAGDQAVANQNYDRAIKWYQISLALFSTDPNLRDVANLAILQRKLVVCYNEIRAMDEAESALREAQAVEPDAPYNHLLGYTLAMTREDKNTAKKCLDAMARLDQRVAFDLLCSAGSIAYKSHDKSMLKHCLHPLTSLKGSDMSPKHREQFLVLLRCLIRLTQDTQVWATGVEDILSYIEKADTLATDMLSSPDFKKTSNFENEMEWYFRVSWNCALDCMSQDVSAVKPKRKRSSQTVPTISSQELFHVRSTHIRCAARVALAFLKRLNGYQQGDEVFKEHERACLMALLINEVELLQTQQTDDNPGASRAQSWLQELKNSYVTEGMPCKMLRQVILLEFELAIYASNWEAIPDLVQQATLCEQSTGLLNCMGDRILRSHTPSGVVFITLQAALNSLLREAIEVDFEAFSQWFRILIKSAMVNNKLVALRLYEQIQTLVNCNTDQVYPEAELQWLVVNAWNTGCEAWTPPL
ncbi:hypothetical protein CXG81DRAFT_20128 [Caulochytrium protostelioides]|uniref:Protein ZIP4 homolog n=1 Tax=Caulochytrium protostelioides TaxID=1555241 RepID=A0A4P9X450_9FUNG|nr:hypothetical protein CXG81DRAFT_20128 [Caulochytrium protostelioides]|eukprot:RKO99829.1 hypothetical protein CXG81DRAFT_20128 [Caulochytrium protostelioides]